jgi:hypothetical protein
MSALQTITQSLQCPELQLLHRSFGLAQLLRDFSNAPLLHKARKDHAPLLAGKLLDHAKKLRSLFEVLLFSFRARLRAFFPAGHLARGSFPLVDNQICRNPH